MPLTSLHSRISLTSPLLLFSLKFTHSFLLLQNLSFLSFLSHLLPIYQLLSLATQSIPLQPFPNFKSYFPSSLNHILPLHILKNLPPYPSDPFPFSLPCSVPEEWEEHITRVQDRGEVSCTRHFCLFSKWGRTGVLE